MTDLEYAVLDELYFVISYPELKKATDIQDNDLKTCLGILYQKGWIKCMETVSDELPANVIDLENKFESYYYLATKTGLMAHNQI